MADKTPETGPQTGRFAIDRRALLTAAAASALPLSLAPSMASARVPKEEEAEAFLSESALEETLTRLAAAGPLPAGGPGDEAMADHLEQLLQGAGYATRRQPFDTPFFLPGRVELAWRDGALPLVALAPFRQTPQDGVGGPIRIRRLGETAGDVSGALVLVELPHARHSSLSPRLRAQLADLALAGAVGAIIVTTGPTGNAIPLNAAPDVVLPLPTALVGNRAARALLLSGDPGAGRLFVRGEQGTRTAHNLIGTMPRPGGRWVVVSTPRSGWGPCIGERGPGLAVFAALARVLPARMPGHSLLFVSTSAHEYENLGSALFLEHLAPAPDETALWLHLGAGLAARDWHEAGGMLSPMPSADAQRFLVGPEQWLPELRRCFAGIAGLEIPYPLSPETGGELREIWAAGHHGAIGALGAHRLHHLPEDGPGNSNGRLIAPVARAFADACSALSATA